MRHSTRYFVFTVAAGVFLLGLLLVHPTLSAERHAREREERRRLVSALGLTDLCLFTEARYTRHLSQADLHSAFQDHPIAMEHFPSGSLVRPPTGMLEYWNNGKNKNQDSRDGCTAKIAQGSRPVLPSFHYFIIPPFQVLRLQ